MCYVLFYTLYLKKKKITEASNSTYFTMLWG